MSESRRSLHPLHTVIHTYQPWEHAGIDQRRGEEAQPSFLHHACCPSPASTTSPSHRLHLHPLPLPALGTSLGLSRLSWKCSHPPLTLTPPLHSNLPRDLWSLSVPSFFSAWTDYQGPFVCSSATTAQELQDPQVNAPATLEPHCFSPASFCP